MATQFFGQFLLEKGAIDRDALLEAVKYQQGINQPLCALAMQNGFLEDKQLRELDEAHRMSDRGFIEIAMKAGILSFDQVETLSDIKSEKWMFLGEALAQTDALDLVQLHALLEEYRKRHSAPDAQPITSMDDIPEKELVSSFVKITVDLFVHYTKEAVDVLSADNVAIDPDDITYMFAQNVVGEKSFTFALALPEDLTLAVGSAMLNDEMTDITPLGLDAVAEFVNVVIGNGCTKLDLKDVQVSAEPPQIMMKEMLKKVVPDDVVNVHMQTKKGDFNVLFFFPDEDGNLPGNLV